MTQPDSSQSESICIGCEDLPIRPDGPHVSWLEGLSDRLLYCDVCAADCEAGKWESNPDEDDERG